MTIQAPAQQSDNRRVIRTGLIILAFVIGIPLLSLFVAAKLIPSSYFAPQPPAAVMNTHSSPDANQPCNYLDFEGDAMDPDRIILWCDAGQTALVIETKGLERHVRKDGKGTGDGSHAIDVRAGSHKAYSLTIVEQQDGGVDFRVWYDDPKETGNTTSGISTESRVTMREFTSQAITETRAMGYQPS